MNFGVYCIFDHVSEKHIHLFVEDNDATAVRLLNSWFEHLPENQRSDYTLVCIGSWNSGTGMLLDFCYRIVGA